MCQGWGLSWYGAAQPVHVPAAALLCPLLKTVFSCKACQYLCFVLREVKTHFSFSLQGPDMVSVEGTSLSQSAACLWTAGNTGEGLGSRSFLRMG